MARRECGGMQSVAVVLVFLCSAPAAANGQTQTEYGVWTGVSMQGRMSADSQWNWASESMVRARDGAGALDLVGEQVVVSRRLTRRASAGIGYAYLRGFPGTGSLGEHRFVQQYSWNSGTSPRLSLRSRVEERLASGQERALVRVRQQVRVTWPLAASGRLYAVASDELFVHATSTARVPRGFDRNHAFVGLGRMLTPHSRVEVGYLHLQTRGASKSGRRTHVLSVSLSVSL